MAGKGLLKDKRGEEALFNQVIFFVLNAVIFAVMIIFIGRASSGALLQEQAYAKQISILLDSAKPNISIILDMSKPIKIARTTKDIKSTTADSDVLKGIIKIDNNRKEVITMFTKNGGYVFRYFSDYDIKMSVQGVFLTLDIDKKGATANVQGNP